MNEDGELIHIQSSVYGNYTSFDTAKDGVFIVCIPGVAFVMPMWGYAAIAGGVLIALGAGITTFIVLKKKKKSKPIS